VKRQRHQRPDAGQAERALLPVRLALPGAEQDGEACQDAERSQRGAYGSASHQELQGIAVRLLHETLELARLHLSEGLAKGPQARAEKRIRLVGAERQLPDLVPLLLTRIARVRAEEAQERVRPGDGGREPDSGREEDDEHGRAAPTFVEERLGHGDRQEDERGHRGRQDAAPRSRQPEPSGQDPPKDHGPGRGGQPHLRAPRLPPAAGRRYGEDQAEGKRQRDVQVAGQVVRVHEAAVAADLLRLGERGESHLEESREKCGNEEKATAKPGPQEPRGCREQHRVSEHQQCRGRRLVRCDRDAGGGLRRSPESREDLRGLLVEPEARRGEPAQQPRGQRHELHDPEKRDAGYAHKRNAGGSQRPVTPVAEEGRRPDHEREQLNEKRALGLDAAVRERRQGKKDQQEDEPDTLGKGYPGTMTRFQGRYFAALLVLALGSRAQAADPFYLSLLKAGTESYRLTRYPQAADELRVACFGLLEEPPLLVECLARLALVQSALSRTADADLTMARFVDVETKFGAYSRAALQKEVRTEFEDLISSRLRPEVLAMVPSLTGLVETPEKRLSRLDPAQRERELIALSEREKESKVWPLWLARDAAAKGDHKSVVRWATRALEIDPRDTDALALRGHALTARRAHADALNDLRALPPARVAADPQLVGDLVVTLVATKDEAQARALAETLTPEVRARPDVARAVKRFATAAPAAEAAPAPPTPNPQPPPVEIPVNDIVANVRRLRSAGQKAEAKQVLVEALGRAPGSRDLRKELLETEYFLKDWPASAAQLKYLEPFAEGEEPWMFYGAVASYETGNLEGARALLRRARPKIAQNPFVEYYTRKILGTP